MKRSDKLKKHKEVCKRKQEKRNNKENVPPKNTFIVTEAECSDSDNNNEKEDNIQETEEDRNFIDNEEVSEDEMWHVNVNLLNPDHPNHMSEVDQRLEQLNKVREKNQKQCKHCKGWIPKEDDTHEKNCKFRKVPCFKCKKEIKITEIKKHVKECKKKKKKEEKKKTPKKKETKKNKKNKEKAKGKDSGGKDKKRKRKGKQFKLQVHGAKKYRIVKRLTEYNPDLKEYMVPDIIKQFVFGNEFGSGPRPKPHCHGVVVLKIKMTFEEFKKWFTAKTRIKIHDVRSCKNLQHEVKYVTKEDYRAVNYKFDYDMLSMLCLAYISANKYNNLFSSMYPYCRLPPFLKKDFEQHFHHFLVERKEDASLERFLSDDLRVWQLRVVRMLNLPDARNDDRSIIWIVDKEGNKGKSFLSFYLKHQYNAFRITGKVKSTDFAYAYNEEPIVIFDLARDSENYVNYDLMEEIKNGSLWSPKYESAVKTFHHISVIVLVFSNYEPNYSKVSYDRWKMFHLDKYSDLIPFSAPVLPAAFALEGLH